jgi:iron complex outermembrane recepter protein
MVRRFDPLGRYGRSALKYGAAALALALSAASATFAYAQEVQANGVENVMVTGTMIKGVAPIGSNIISVGQDDIQTSGATNVQDLMATVPAVSGFGQNSQFEAGTISGSGENTPTIHNLGESSSLSTLILMNGRPMTPSGTLGVSDPNIIPTIALQRVDVMPDGDSAIYGSSAVAGVINYITRSNYEGLQTSAQWGEASKFQKYAVDIMAGHTWDTGSVYLAWEYTGNSKLLVENRSWAASADLRPYGGANYASVACNPATISPSSASTSPLYTAPYTGATIGTSAALTAYNGNAPCDTSGLGTFFPSSEEQKAFADFKQDIGKRVHLDMNVGYAFHMTELQTPRSAISATAFGPTGSSGALGTGSQNPFYQGNSATGTSSEFVQWDPNALLGPAHTKGGIEDVYANLTASIDIGWGWESEVDYSAGFNNAYIYNRDATCGACANLALNGTTNAGATANTLTNNALSDPNNLGTVVSITRPLNTTNALDVWDAPGSNKTSAAVLQELKGDSFAQINRIAMNDVKFKFDGPLITLPAGELKAAIGGEFQQINYEQLQTAADSAGPSVASSQNLDQTLPRTVRSAFLEFAIPVISPDMGIPGIQKLDFQVAARYDEYSDVGATRNPKLGFNWSVIDGLKARGSYSTSFTAPSIIFLQGLNTVSQATGSNATFTVPTSHLNYPGSFCTQITVNGGCPVTSAFPGIIVSGPNTALKPMTGQSWSAGLDITAGDLWQPLSGWTTNITYWRTKFNGIITLASTIGAGYLNTPGIEQYLQLAPPGGYTTSSPQVQAVLAHAIATSPLPSNIYYIGDQIRVNGLSLIGDGIDFSSQYSYSAGKWGDFQIGYAASWKLDWNVAGGPNGSGNPYTSYLNGRNDTSVIKAEAFDGRGNFGWTLQNWTLNLFWNYTNPYWYRPNKQLLNPTQYPAGYPNASYAGTFQRVAANNTFDLNIAYVLPEDWIDGWAKGTTASLYVKNISNAPPPFYNFGGVGSPSVGYNGDDTFNADPLGRMISVALRKTF